MILNLQLQFNSIPLKNKISSFFLKTFSLEKEVKKDP